MITELENNKNREVKTPPKLEILFDRNDSVVGRDTNRSTLPSDRDERSITNGEVNEVLKSDLDEGIPDTLKRKQDKTIITRDSTLSNFGSFKASPPCAKQPREEYAVPEDWYGNTALHNMFATHETNPADILSIIQAQPLLVTQANQFGRIPLHYAVDRGKVNVKGLEILLQYFPKGVEVQDHEGKTPYDIAMKWNHPRSIFLRLLAVCPDVDRAHYMKLKYGPIGSLAHWATSSFRNSKTFHELDQDQEQVDSSDNDISLLEEEATTYALTGGGISRSSTIGEMTIFAPALSRAHSRRVSVDSIHSE